MFQIMMLSHSNFVLLDFIFSDDDRIDGPVTEEAFDEFRTYAKNK